MGLVYANLRLVNSEDKALARRGFLPANEVKSVEVTALVDSGAYMMCLNETIQAQLDLPLINEQAFQMADGQVAKRPVVGPLEVEFANRSTSCRAVILPGDAEILLGSIPMEDLDVVILPKEQKLVVNPEHPYVAQKKLK